MKFVFQIHAHYCTRASLGVNRFFSLLNMITKVKKYFQGTLPGQNNGPNKDAWIKISQTLGGQQEFLVVFGGMCATRLHICQCQFEIESFGSFQAFLCSTVPLNFLLEGNFTKQRRQCQLDYALKIRICPMAPSVA